MSQEDRKVLKDRFAADRPRPIRRLAKTLTMYVVVPYVILRFAGLLVIIGVPVAVSRFLGLAMVAFYLGAMHTLTSDTRQEGRLSRARQQADLASGVVDVLEFSPLRAWAIDIGPGTEDSRRFGGYLAQVSPTRFIAMAMDKAIDGDIPAAFPKRVRWACAPSTRETLEFQVSEERVPIEEEWLAQIEFWPLLKDDFGYGPDCVRELRYEELPPSLRSRLL